MFIAYVMVVGVVKMKTITIHVWLGGGATCKKNHACEYLSVIKW